MITVVKFVLTMVAAACTAATLAFIAIAIIDPVSAREIINSLIERL